MGEGQGGGFWCSLVYLPDWNVLFWAFYGVCFASSVTGLPGLILDHMLLFIRLFSKRDCHEVGR